VHTLESHLSIQKPSLHVTPNQARTSASGVAESILIEAVLQSQIWLLKYFNIRLESPAALLGWEMRLSAFFMREVLVSYSVDAYWSSPP